MIRPLAAALALLLTMTGAASARCGADPSPCEIQSGSYHVLLPAGAPKGTIMFLHGWGGSGKTALGNKRWVPQAVASGYAVIAPDGMPREGRKGRRWNFHPDWPQSRDDLAFLVAVRDDAVKRFGLDPERIALGGFSIGGSMTHYVACADPDAFFAYIPVGGAFWRPHPGDCSGAVRLLHTHGWTDTTVPLEGRVVRGADVNDPNAFVQGDVFHAMDLWRNENGCMQLRGDRFETAGPFWRRSWERCTEGTALELALFPGGHTVPDGWIDMTIGWLGKL